MVLLNALIMNEQNTVQPNHHHHHHPVELLASILSEFLLYECPLGAVPDDTLCQIFPSYNSQVVHQYFIVIVWASINVDGLMEH
jgi:hypothetical protein